MSPIIHEPTRHLVRSNHESWECLKFFDFDPRGWMHEPYTVGKCPACGRYFYVKPSLGELRFWYPVRSWNSYVRKLIRVGRTPPYESP